jgi:[acyl-carrier-protein] S-malonyltransferase
VELAREQGATKAILLNVSGPFHSKLMTSASQMMEDELKKYTFSNPIYPVITNCDAQITKDHSNVKEKLAKQINNSVKWDASIFNAVAGGVEMFIEVGPQRVLSGLMRRIDKSKKVLNIEDSISLEKIVKELNQ